MAQHIAATRTYIIVWASLLALLLATVVAATFDLGPFNLVVSLVIAIIKALLVILFFMHVRWASRVTWVFAGAAFLWLGIMMILTSSDYVTRGSMPGGRAFSPAMVPITQGVPIESPAPR